ncbi:MAG: hypothetical protein QOD60_1179 [Solirubrobacterales bacterium]|jgi:hypothetical protein|nr:hypothetical protein [Solirubrobacterales bacterium]
MGNWLYGGYPDPWRSVLRALFVGFWVAFTAQWWSSLSYGTLQPIILGILAVQIGLALWLRSKYS